MPPFLLVLILTAYLPTSVSPKSTIAMSSGCSVAGAQAATPARTTLRETHSTQVGQTGTYTQFIALEMLVTPARWWERNGKQFVST